MCQRASQMAIHSEPSTAAAHSTYAPSRPSVRRVFSLVELVGMHHESAALQQRPALVLLASVLAPKHACMMVAPYHGQPMPAMLSQHGRSSGHAAASFLWAIECCFAHSLSYCWGSCRVLSNRSCLSLRVCFCQAACLCIHS